VITLGGLGIESRIQITENNTKLIFQDDLEILISFEKEYVMQAYPLLFYYYGERFPADCLIHIKEIDSNNDITINAIFIRDTKSGHVDTFLLAQNNYEVTTWTPGFKRIKIENVFKKAGDYQVEIKLQINKFGKQKTITHIAEFNSKKSPSYFRTGYYMIHTVFE
jgi:hypothetical protein